MKTTTEIIAREGWRAIIIVAVFLVLALLWHFKILFALCVALILCLLYFYRNVERIAEDVASDTILAPLDVVIKDIQRKDDGIYLEINKPICFCGMIRMPIAHLGKCGEVLRGERVYGLKNGDKITGERIQISFNRDFEATNSAFSLTLYPKYLSQISIYDSSFRLGERVGFFLNGRAVFRIPLESELRASVGDMIYAGKTLLGRSVA